MDFTRSVIRENGTVLELRRGLGDDQRAVAAIQQLERNLKTGSREGKQSAAAQHGQA